MLDKLSTIDLMALLIRAEADDQPEAGKVAVAYTLLTRAAMRPWRYGRDVRAVALKPLQYSCFNHPRHWQRFYTPHAPAWTAAQALSLAVLNGEVANPAPGATHYYNPALVTPYWAKPEYAKWIAEIGDHVFMQEIF